MVINNLARKRALCLNRGCQNNAGSVGRNHSVQQTVTYAPSIVENGAGSSDGLPPAIDEHQRRTQAQPSQIYVAGTLDFPRRK